MEVYIVIYETKNTSKTDERIIDFNAFATKELVEQMLIKDGFKKN